MLPQTEWKAVACMLEKKYVITLYGVQLLLIICFYVVMLFHYLLLLQTKANTGYLAF